MYNYEWIGLAVEKPVHLEPAFHSIKSRNTTRGIKMKHILLTQGKFAIVDDEDYEWLNQYKWSAHKTKYGGFMAIRTSKRPQRKMIYMHRQIMNCPKEMDVDHQNHNTLNNLKSNLRICTRSQNCQNSKICKNNSSGYKGVTWFNQRKYKDKKYKGKWRAQITHNNKNFHLGLFNNKTDAAKAYDIAAIKYFGEFANLNFSTKTNPTKAK